MDTPKSIPRNTAIFFFGQILILLANFFSIVLISRTVSVEDFGIFNFGLVFISYFAVLANFGMKPILFRELSRSRDPAAREEILSKTLTLKLILTTMTWMLIIATALLLRLENQAVLVILCLSFLLFISAKLETLRIAGEVYYYARKDVKIPIVLQILDAGFQVALLLTAYILRMSVLWIAVLFVCSSLPGFLMLFFTLRSRITLTIDFAFFRWMAKESFPLLLYILIVTLHDRIDIALLKLFRDYHSIGLYSAVIRLVNPLAFLASAMLVSIYPYLSQSNGDKSALEIFHSGLKLLLFLVALFAAGVAPWSARILGLIFGTEYMSASVPFLFLLFSRLFSFTVLFYVDLNNAKGLQQKNVWIAALLLSTNLPLNLWFIPTAGITGAAAAKIGSLSAGSLLAIWLGRRFYSSRTLIALVKNGILLATILAGFSVLKLPAAPQSLVSLILLVLGSWALQYFSAEEIQKARILVNGFIQKWRA
jgi:O-antigen/teichoic acid export membrane protein